MGCPESISDRGGYEIYELVDTRCQRYVEIASCYRMVRKRSISRDSYLIGRCSMIMMANSFVPFAFQYMEASLAKRSIGLEIMSFDP